MSGYLRRRDVAVLHRALVLGQPFGERSPSLTYVGPLTIPARNLIDKATFLNVLGLLTG